MASCLCDDLVCLQWYPCPATAQSNGGSSGRSPEGMRKPECACQAQFNRPPTSGGEVSNTDIYAISDTRPARHGELHSCRSCIAPWQRYGSSDLYGLMFLYVCYGAGHRLLFQADYGSLKNLKRGPARGKVCGFGAAKAERSPPLPHPPPKNHLPSGRKNIGKG